MAGRRLSVGGVDFSEPSRGVLLNAAYYDVVLVVGSPLEYSGRAEVYRSLGVESRLFQLKPIDTPLILTLLGLLGWIEAQRKKNLRILVEIEGKTALLPASYLVLKGRRVVEAILEAKTRGFTFYTPLQLRLLVLLWILQSNGISLARIADNYSKNIFTEPDIYYSLMLEHIIEHYYYLASQIPLRLTAIYKAVFNPRKTRQLSAEEMMITKIASTLSHTTIITVRNTFLEKTRETKEIQIHIGCTTLLQSEACQPEIEKTKEYYETIAQKIGGEKTVKTVFYVRSPEEVACMGYKDLCRLGL